MDGAVHEFVLSRTQRQVLLHVADTGSVAGAAARLHLSPRTVERHLDDIRGRLGVRTTVQCVLWALRGGLWEGLQTEPVRTVAPAETATPAAAIDVPLASASTLQWEPIAGHFLDGRVEGWSAGWAHDGMWLYFEALLPQPAGHDSYAALTFAAARRWWPGLAIEHALTEDRPHSLHLVGQPGPGGWEGYDYHNRDSGGPPRRPVRIAEPTGTWRTSRLADGGIHYHFRTALWLLPFRSHNEVSLVIAAGREGHLGQCSFFPQSEAGLPTSPATLRLAPNAQGNVAAPPAQRLTPRELDVLKLVGQLGTMAGVAERLGCSPRTVEEHLAHLRGKLDGRTVIECVVWGWAMGVLA